jgi:hypothetical protein
VNISIGLEKVGGETQKLPNFTARQDVFPNDVQGTTGDALVIVLALSQLENCRLNHEACGQALLKRGALSARLLDLSRYIK